MAKGVFHLLMAILVVGSPVALASDWGSTAGHTKDRAGIAADGAKARAEEMRVNADEGVHDWKEKAESWAGWARDKASQGLGLGKDGGKETAHKMKDKAGDAAGKTRDAFNNAASGGASYASDAHEMGRKLEEQKDKVADSAPKAYEDGKHKAGEAYETAKNTMSHQAKSNYEATKEKLSHAAGQVGATMGAVEEL